MAFDGTYLTKSINQLKLHDSYGLVGGVWDPWREDAAWVDLNQDGLDVRGLPKASTMLEFVCWDPGMYKKSTLSVCSMPMAADFGGVHAEKKGQWSILEVVGRVMKASGHCIRGLVFDAHGSHALVRKVLSGQLVDVNKDQLNAVPWFSELRFCPLPSTVMPRLPIQLAMHEGEAVFGLPGPCNLDQLGVKCSEAIPRIIHINPYNPTPGVRYCSETSRCSRSFRIFWTLECGIQPALRPCEQKCFWPTLLYVEMQLFWPAVVRHHSCT